jgi:hypothetical protein
VKEQNGEITLIISGEQEMTCQLVQDKEGIWNGRWERFEKMPIRLIYKGSLLNLTARSAFFHEAGNGHYDRRFYRGTISSELCKEGLVALLRAFVDLCSACTIRPILMHGSLIGWHWNKKLLPWDDDIDFCLCFKDLSALEARLREGTELYNYNRYLLEINPNHNIRESLNRHHLDNREPNKIDARFIDKRSGLFIDITALSHSSPNMLKTKCPHFYSITDIFPIQFSQIEDIDVGIPANVKNILSQEYGLDVLTKSSFGGYYFNLELLLWLPITNGISRSK